MRNKHLLFLILLIGIILGTGSLTNAEEKDEIVRIVFTHDLHSHIESFPMTEDGKTEQRGGLTRIKTLLDEQRSLDPNVLVLDGGDFSMGTLFQTIYETNATELKMLGMLGYDATTIGNHEFDYQGIGVANMLMAAKKSKQPLPEVVLANLDWTDAAEEQLTIKKAMDEFGVKPYTMLDKGGLRIAVFGSFGKDALACAPRCGLKFEDPVKNARKTVDLILEKEKPDMIICLSHGGTNEDSRKSEDEIMAKKVPEIDVIISAHTHTMLEKPIIVGETVIASCGEFGKNMGTMQLKRAGNGRYELEEYQLIPVNEDIKANAEIKEAANAYKKLVDKEYLSYFGYTFDQVLANLPYNLTGEKEVETEHTDQALGDFLADALRYAANQAEGSSNPSQNVDVTIVPSGVIRGDFPEGDVTVKQVFAASSLGIGPDRIPGYPLVRVYLTGKELKDAAEVDASISNIMAGTKLYTSGLGFSFHPKRMFLNRVTDVWLLDQEEQRLALDDDQLYQVVSDLYTGQMLGAVKEKSMGLIKLEPKDEQGNLVDDIEKQIIYKDGKEIKAWDAVAQYMQSFPKQDGVPMISSYYEKAHERKVVDQQSGIVEILKKPNAITWIVGGIGILLVAVVVGILVFIIRRSNRRGRNRGRQRRERRSYPKRSYPKSAYPKNPYRIRRKKPKRHRRRR